MSSDTYDDNQLNDLIEQFSNSVVVLTKPGCQQCRATERRLSRAGISYTAIDISDKPELITSLKNSGFLALPVVKQQDGKFFSGYRPDLVKKIIELSNPNLTHSSPGPAVSLPHASQNQSPKLNR